MGTKQNVAITPTVLEWAIAESGFALADLAADIGVDERRLQSWLSSTGRPGLSELKALAKKLHRQVAVFLLPAPPAGEHVSVQFRHPVGAQRTRPLAPQERRFLRRAKRLQDAEAWLVAELGRDAVDIPKASLSNRADTAAAAWRERLGVTVAAQRGWKTAAAAFDRWREAVERTGVTVVQFSVGPEACRGFSLWHDVAPLIAINTAWSDEARIFTLFHELGHLLTRTNSACAAAPATPNAGDPAERWCEQFAAAVLIPPEALFGVGRTTKLDSLSRLARALKVSLRATAIRLIDRGKASWSLYNEIPAASDAKRGGGGGGTGRNRGEARQDEFGPRTTALFVAAVQRDIISESQALDYLDIPSSQFERLSASPTA